jgi:N utilization substance protein B
MNSRRKAREAALQALYQCDTLEDWSDEAIALYFSVYNPEAIKVSAGAAQENVDFARTIIHGVIANISVIDSHITGASTHWSVARMPRVDRNILRCATFEIIFASDIPVSVSINEAIEIAKRYGTAESSMFINGVLDKIATTLMAHPELALKASSLPREKKLAVNE